MEFTIRQRKEERSIVTLAEAMARFMKGYRLDIYVAVDGPGKGIVVEGLCERGVELTVVIDVRRSAWTDKNKGERNGDNARGKGARGYPPCVGDVREDERTAAQATKELHNSKVRARIRELGDRDIRALYVVPGVHRSVDSGVGLSSRQTVDSALRLVDGVSNVSETATTWVTRNPVGTYSPVTVIIKEDDLAQFARIS